MITVAYSLTTYRVNGLSEASCEHCLASIRSELILVPGIVGVDLNAEESKISVLTDGPVDDAWIRDAIDAAGCDILSS
ncbi:heavy-metal-associated domain-containing protein [Nonomuraea sp. NPDC049269]|uniref:heavy-metal-associated domain-containing protein n=1 Tax=Nonomuraea sp. NPDC049269 TaxID=3364349 RepID=UPI0037184E30